MEELKKYFLNKLCRGYSFLLDSDDSDSDDSDSEQLGEGVTTRARAQLQVPVHRPVHRPSPEPNKLSQDLGSESESELSDAARQPEPNNSNLLFIDKHTVFKNKEIKLYVIKDYLKRQKIFRLDDHLYQLKAEIMKDKAPLISSILNVLHQALEFVIASLKKNYNPGKKLITFIVHRIWIQFILIYSLLI